MLQFILVAMGKQKLSDYLAHRNTVRAIERQGEATALQIEVSQRDQQRAIEAGLGAIEGRVSQEVGTLTYTIEFGLDKVANGLQSLNADFNLLMGDVVLHLQMQQAIAKNLLEEVRLPEFVREAREYRARGERAYKKKWFDKALKDFLAAEECNYEEFSVYPLIASIYFYEQQDLPEALEYFRKGAQYSRNNNNSFSAECHYFAGMVLAAQQQHRDALEELQNAVELNPNFHEAHYWHACLASLLNDEKAASDSLTTAIKGDPKYHERAKTDPAFDNIRTPIQSLLDQILKEGEEKFFIRVEEVDLAITTVREVVESKLILKWLDVQNRLKEEARQGNYAITLTAINDAQNLRDEILESAESVLKKQIKDTREQINNKANELRRLIKPLKNLEAEEAAIVANYQELKGDDKGCVHALLGCGVLLFLSPILIGGLISGSIFVNDVLVSKKLINDDVQGLFIFVGVVLGLAGSVSCHLWIYDVIRDYRYKRLVIKPTKEIRAELLLRREQTASGRKSIAGKGKVLERQLEDIERKYETVRQLPLRFRHFPTNHH